MKDRNKLIIAIVAVLIIVALVGGATFAYWTWVSNSAQQTNVSFTLPEDAGGADMDADGDGNPDLYATLEGNGTTTATDLKPTTCNGSNAIVKTVTIKYRNQTVQAATISATLNVTAFTARSTSYLPTSTTLGYLKYALTTSSTSCTTGVQKNGTFNGLTFSSTVTPTNLPLTLFTQTISASADGAGGAEKTQTYYLYIWLDSSYEHTNTGSVNSDPMQGLSFTTQWSGSIVQG